MNIPLKQFLESLKLVNTLSIRVAVQDEIRVGLFIVGYIEWEKLISVNSLVGAWDEELRRLRL